MYCEGEELNITPTADESYHIPEIVNDGGIFSVEEVYIWIMFVPVSLKIS